MCAATVVIFMFVFRDKLVSTSRIDRLAACPVGDGERKAVRTYRIFIGAGTRQYLSPAKHLVASLEGRSGTLVADAAGIRVLTSASCVEECERLMEEVQAECVAASPIYQQIGTHVDVYNKFDVIKHTNGVDWVVYFDADMVVVDELAALMTTIPQSYVAFGVKNYPSVFQRILLEQEAWGLNAGFLAFDKSLLTSNSLLINRMMEQGINDQVIWSTLFERATSAACLLSEEYNCRPNTHRRCHSRAKIIHYSSTSKHALYYFNS